MVTLIKYGALGGGEKYNVNQMWIDGLSTDSKPTTTIDGMGIPNGSAYTEVDTGKTYMFDKENTTWYEVSIGGGGGTSGLASKDIGAMTGYAKAQTAGAIATSDTLNQAIGKVEKRVSDNENNILLKPSCTLLPTGTDLDTVDRYGVYMLAYSGTYPNDPIGSGYRRYLIVERAESENYTVQRVIRYDNTPTMMTRYRAGNPSVWYSWSTDYSNNMPDNIITAYTTDTITATAANVGTNIKILTYNLSGYKNDTISFISDEKIFNLKKAIGDIGADFCAFQEDSEYIDSGNTKKSQDYIYKPIYPYKAGAGGVTVVSKILADNNDVLSYTNGRQLRYAKYTLDNKTLLFVSTHPVAGDSASNITARATQYTELFQWIAGLITLNKYGTQTPITVPTWDYCIIGMDSNASTATDKENLKTIVASNNFTMGNGGYFGWIETRRNSSGTVKESIDTIICSSNITINNITSYSSKYNSLYSDHYPVMAEITLH